MFQSHEGCSSAADETAGAVCQWFHGKRFLLGRQHVKETGLFFPCYLVSYDFSGGEFTPQRHLFLVFLYNYQLLW